MGEENKETPMTRGTKGSVNSDKSIKRRTLLYSSALQDILDSTVQNDVICNYVKLVMFSIYVADLIWI